jgi:lysophospholipase L1-like esterase
MSHLALALLLVLATAAASVAASAPAAPAKEPTLSVAVPASDPNLRYIGRFDRAGAVARCAWSATSITIRFKGTAIGARVASGGAAFLQVVVDGKAGDTVAVPKQEELVVLAKGLPAKEHVVEIVKRTEATQGSMSFAGFALEPGGAALPLPKRSDRRFEIYGDSITCGYGNEAKSQDEHFTPATENAWLSYGPAAARALGAECSLISVSGIKLWPDNDLPPQHDNVLVSWDNGPKANFKEWVPQAVIINLGTNDFRNGPPDEKGWCDAMRGFIKTLRGHYPGCHVYLATGSMMNGAQLDTLKRWLDGIVDGLAKAGDKKIHRLDFDTQQMSDGLGADWHPSVKTDQIMGEKLAAALRKDLGW